MFNTDPDVRTSVINGLRQLADFLDTHPDLPVPPGGFTFYIYADRTDNGGKAQVDATARQLGSTAYDDTDESGTYYTMCEFGHVRYNVTALTKAGEQQYFAHANYWGCEKPR